MHSRGRLQAGPGSGSSYTKTLVVCGDSTASAIGLPADSILGAYPSRLKSALRSRGFRVISHARPGRTIAAAVAELDRVVDLDPDLVLISHGGLENAVRFAGLLAFLPVPPIVAGERRRPAHRLRRVLYRPLFAALQHPVGEKVLQRLGIATSQPAERIHRDYATLVDELLERTSAQLILVRPATGRMSFQPWRSRGLAALGDFLADLAESSQRLSFVDLDAAHLDWSLFQPDGTHLTTEGHAAAFEILRTAMRRVAASSTLPASAGRRAVAV